MAKRKVVTCICDVCWSNLGVEEVARRKGVTVAFGKDSYRLDMCEKHYVEIRRAMWIILGRDAAELYTDKEIRLWAAARGIKVSERGKIPALIREAYGRSLHKP